MVNNTETYWEADGQSLHTYVRSIETIGGMGPPPLRGEDVTIPYLSGQKYMPKFHDSNVITLGMWLRGVSTDGAGASAATKTLYQSAYNDLIRLLWTPGRQITLTKRFYDGGVLRTASALAEYVGGLSPTMLGNNGSRFTVNMKIAGGVFYDTTAQVFTLADGDQTLNFRGNAPTRNISVAINGARTNAQVRIKSPGVDHLVKYQHALLAGDTCTLDVINYISTTVGEGPTYDSSTDIIHSGAPYWLELSPGNNVVNLSSTSGIGSVQLTVKGAWV